MAAPLGIGDILAITQIVLIICKDAIGAPSELGEAAEELRTMTVTLKVLAKEMSSKDSVLNSQPSIKRRMLKDLGPIKDNLDQVRKMLEQYVKQNGISWARKLRFAVLDKTKLVDLRQSCSAWRENFGFVCDVISLGTASENRTALSDVKTLLLQVLENQMQPKPELNAAGPAKMGGRSAPVPQQKPNAFELLGGLRAELIKTGHSPRDVEPVLMDLSKLLIREPSTLAPATASRKTRGGGLREPSPGEVKAADFRLAAPNDSLDRRKSDSGTTTKVPTSKQSSKGSEYQSILCVDWYNGMCSTLAQTYLEILRLFTAYWTGRWLFMHVQSAGINLAADTSKPSPVIRLGKKIQQSGKPLPLAAIDAIDTEGYDWGKGPPHELAGLVPRLKHYKTSGMVQDDFWMYDMILCFDRDMAKHLESVRGQVKTLYPKKNMAKIVVVPGCARFEVNVEGNVERMRAMLTAVTEGLKGVIERELGDWSMPKCLRQDNGTRHRILQFCASWPAGTDIGDVRPKIDEIEKITECRIKLTSYSGPVIDAPEWQVLISVLKPGNGGRYITQKLATAEQMVRDALKKS